MVRLPNHVVSTPAQATVLPPSAKRDSEVLTLTVVLRRDDAAGFERYLHDVYDPASAVFRQFLTQAELSERFGPSRRTYHQLLAYLRTRGLAPVARAESSDAHRAWDAPRSSKPSRFRCSFSVFS